MVLKFRNWGKVGIFCALIYLLLFYAGYGMVQTGLIFYGEHCSEWQWQLKHCSAILEKGLKVKGFSVLYTIVSWFITFHIVTFLWIFFPAQDLHTAGLMIKQVFTNMDLAYIKPFLSVRKLYIEITFLGIALYLIPAKWFPMITQRFIKTPFWVKALIFIVVVQLVIQFQSADAQPFLYAQF